MAYLIGTDEAGYGPFLGPLVIATSVWQVPDLEVDLRDHLGRRDRDVPGRCCPCPWSLMIRSVFSSGSEAWEHWSRRFCLLWRQRYPGG